MTYEQIVIINALNKLDGINPGDKMRAANWILNDCEDSQLSEIARLAKISSASSREFFVKAILNPERILKEGAD